MRISPSFLLLRTYDLQESHRWAEVYYVSVDAKYCVVGKMPTVKEIRRHWKSISVTVPWITKGLRFDLYNYSRAYRQQAWFSARSRMDLLDNYICLSYVEDIASRCWESKIPGLNSRVILMNGQPLRIRQNLFDYLRTARHNATRIDWDLSQFDLSIPFWIDALCTDQQDIGERNH